MIGPAASKILNLPSQNCADRDCSLSRSFWRRFRGRHGGFELNGKWYCAAQCFQHATESRVSQLLNARPGPTRVLHRIPLGLLLLSRGQLNNTQLRSALARQQIQNATPLGALLTQMGYTDEQQVTAALAAQWACPTLSGGMRPDAACEGLLPARIIEHFRVLPVRFTERTRTFCVAFSEGINYPLLYTIDSLLDCRTEACVISRREMDCYLRTRKYDAGRDVFFDHQKKASEIAHILVGYALKSGAEKVRVAGCERYIWARLEQRGEVANVLFQCGDRPSPELSAPGSLPDRQAVG